MNPEYRIPEEKTQEVFTLAAQLYALHNQSYSVTELMAAGAEAKIPPEFIQQAIEQLQLQHSPTGPSLPTKRSHNYILGLAVGLPLLATIAVAGWLVARNAQLKEAPIQTVQPMPHQPPLSDAKLGAANFKCAQLNLEGQDLRNQNFKGADCHDAKLKAVNLSGVNLEGANLSHTDLKDANLSNANLRGADLAAADLAKADLRGANLEGANLSHTDLWDANLSNANLQGTDLAGAKLNGAILNGSKR
jgi:hypothetical protein